MILVSTIYTSVSLDTEIQVTYSSTSNIIVAIELTSTIEEA